MKKKAVSLLLAGTMAAMTLAGCGSASSSTSGSSAKSASSAASASSSSSKSSGKTNKNAKYKIGVIQLVQHPALDAATQGFEDALKDEFGDDVSVDVENAAGDSATCSTIANNFVSQNVDLIMANATASLQAAVQATSTIPILGTSVTDYATALDMDDWSGTTGINVSGTSDLAPLDQQADMLEELFPAEQNENVGILYCTAEPNSKYQADQITKYLQDKGYTVTAYTFSDTNDVASVTKNAAADSDVLYIPTDNTAASCASTISPIALDAKVPIICGEEGICKGCGVATLSINYHDLGYATGQQAVKILKDGADPSTMKVETASKVTKEYNPDICKQLGITIPDDYTAIDMSEK